MTSTPVPTDAEAAEQINEVFAGLQPGKVGYVREINGYAVSVANVDGQPRVRVDAHRDAATTEPVPTNEVPEEGPSTKVSGCTTANIVAGGVFALGAAGIGYLLAAGGSTVVILGYTFTRAAAQQLQALLSGAAAFETIVSAVAPYVC